MDRVGAAPGPDDASYQAPVPRLLRRLRAAGSGGSARSEPARLVEELESELALLREENARLKMARARTGDRPLTERVRELLPLQSADERTGDEPWELLTECLMLRDGLIDACHEIERGMRETRGRLDEIFPPAEDPREAGAAAEPLLRDDLESVA
jgi:hypothetical protein